ncbi:MAG TPA: hypothetical protein VEJ87_03545 [Acidimicrobiales bacterium]|nr:hypothetical protein [Acidimicrobiales bacterium]
MEPKPSCIQDLAIADPIAAYGIILGVPRIPISINASGSFSSASLDQLPIDAALDTTIAQRTWIDNMQYSVQQPNCFAGSIFKTLYDACLRQVPSIGVRCTVQSGPRYLVSPNFTPLENFVNLMASRYVSGWPLYKQQSIEVEFILLQAPPFAVGDNASPYNVTLTFNGWQFLDHSVDEISVDSAAEALRGMGLWVPQECP